MPLIRMETSAPIPTENRDDLALALSRIAADAIGKPESYVMAVVTEAAVTMAGKTGPAAFLQVCSIGKINQTVNRDITTRVADLLQERLGISAERIYISFNDVQAVNWGWNRTTFG